jgi:hypothetical protein
MTRLAFGIHALRAESVAWATDRGDVLCATFDLTALLAYVRAVEGSGGLRWRRWGEVTAGEAGRRRPRC